MYIKDIRTLNIYAAFMVKYVSCIYSKKHRRRIYERRPNIIYVHIKNCIYFFIAGHIFSSDWVYSSDTKISLIYSRKTKVILEF